MSSVDLLSTRRGAVIVASAIAVVFLAVRLALLAVREPFFDELFTAWMAPKPFAGILRALRDDSGPPLFYFAAHAMGLPGVQAIRGLALAAGAGALALLLAVRPRAAGLTAAALFAVYPPAALFSVDARPYAFCALLSLAGVLASGRGRPFLAAAMFALAAYCHYYGVLFFPVLLVPSGAGSPRDGGGAALVRRAGALAAACVLFAPGFWLAARQPRQSMEWLLPRNLPFPPTLSFAGEYPYALFASLPPWAAWLALLVLLAALAGPLARHRAGGGRPAPVPGDPPGIAVLACATSIPLLLAIALGLYFPMRLESVIAAPMALWVALSLDAWSRPIRRLLFGLLVALGLLASCVGISDHALRPLDDYRAAALWTARHAAPGERVVASGYCYLETVVAAGPRVTAFPSEQAAHPGWRAASRMDAKPPEGPFLWIGELAAPELAILRGTRKVEPVYVNARALVARVR